MLFIGFMLFGLFEVVFMVIFFTCFITAIVKIIKRTGGSQNNTTTYTSNNVSGNQQADSKYKTINSHYSPETLNGTRNHTIYKKDAYGTTVQPVHNGTFRTDYEVSQSHNHAYEHKVEPISEASVHELFDERKQAYRERKAEMKADLPKSSYSVVEEKVMKSNSSKYRDVQGVFAKNGDNIAEVTQNEEMLLCQYCGAKNIVPRNRSITYKCYFCRQEV